MMTKKEQRKLNREFHKEFRSDLKWLSKMANKAKKDLAEKERPICGLKAWAVYIKILLNDEKQLRQDSNNTIGKRNINLIEFSSGDYNVTSMRSTGKFEDTYLAQITWSPNDVNKGYAYRRIDNSYIQRALYKHGKTLQKVK